MGQSMPPQNRKRAHGRKRLRGKTLRLPPHGAAGKNLHPDATLNKVPTPTPVQENKPELPKTGGSAYRVKRVTPAIRKQCMGVCCGVVGVSVLWLCGVSRSWKYGGGKCWYGSYTAVAKCVCRLWLLSEVVVAGVSLVFPVAVSQ